ncbi:MAG TPA: SIS domain-containing protein [Steroidobacteraceae bacterium]|nr:SIS domain-containing protein [Steroidobacteraceae bacterium]
MSAAALPVMEGEYFRDLMEQPAALEATLGWLRASGRWRDVRHLVQSRRWQRVVLTGMGSSYHTLQPLYWSLIAGGFNAVLVETSELIHYGMALCDAQSLIILVSQSGASAETVRLLELQCRSPVLGVTNTEHSPLARGADLSILVQAGTEFSVSCKTYVGGMLSLQWLAAIFADAAEARTLQRLGPAAELAGRYLKDWRGHVDALAAPLRDIRHLFLAGRGDSLAAVCTGALIIKEAAHFHAEGMSSAALRHGPLEMLQADMLTVVFEGDERTRPLNQRLAAELVTKGRRCLEIGSESAFPALRLPECDGGLRPIVEILPLQMMSLVLASLGGREAGRFEHTRKITDSE